MRGNGVGGGEEKRLQAKIFILAITRGGREGDALLQAVEGRRRIREKRKNEIKTG